ncbi:uncharacterized protein EHS24_006216 [Apiotrichum porosum]|uniref:Macro domain-containing protein n=1 Tax=Apiotrichum porosum TaxID=105984 RepID=A0A427Y0W2_9TREE|nr:uncharacterized protein EHS24_006216 [Apiotrichum porosum]RSH84692.1 hypothetical protein EHS24_006216 [Apiotrichum porosum]
MATLVSDLPTIAQQYADRKLHDSKEPSKFKADAALAERVTIWRGDITKLNADMIVNAANKSLLGGGGVDGAIHRGAGPSLFAECLTLNGAETGETKVTSGYNLPAKRVAHTVGPIYSSSRVEQCAEQLHSCYRTSLELCAKHGGGSIGFSSISTGIYGYPIEDATRIALETTRRFLESNENVSRVIYVVFSERDEDVYDQLAPEYFPRI